MDEDILLWNEVDREVDRTKSSDFGRDCRVPLLGGGTGRVGVLMSAKSEGFFLIGGVMLFFDRAM